MTKEDDILVRIGGQTHRLRSEDPASLRKIPWPQRKRLIEVLEALKKAEYLGAEKNRELVSQQVQPIRRNQFSDVAKTAPKVSPQTAHKPTPEKPEEGNTMLDSDAMMQRFLAEQKNDRSSIPSKVTIYKWFLIVFVVILLLVLML